MVPISQPHIPTNGVVGIPIASPPPVGTQDRLLPKIHNPAPDGSPLASKRPSSRVNLMSPHEDLPSLPNDPLELPESPAPDPSTSKQTNTTSVRSADRLALVRVSKTPKHVAPSSTSDIDPKPTQGVTLRKTKTPEGGSRPQ
ncbi:hypothetical protein PtA15_10A175 [Puccinia triticina]|uniref:Uncharacterized protein n=1 Tax=Puccinia triticina TaxID=208348 RepID=A0ABY7CU34_9BASI|nr:uncharacterized protein PtA15_10A175 [Puccinia triticina]WAQ88756.1 hypothetical protein PtA15_10A175 [Puccinia triticina]